MSDAPKKLTPAIIKRVRALSDELSELQGYGCVASVALRAEAENLERVLETEVRAEIAEIIGCAKDGKSAEWSDVLVYLKKIPTNADELTYNILRALGSGTVHHVRHETYVGDRYDYNVLHTTDEFWTPNAKVKIEAQGQLPWVWVVK